MTAVRIAFAAALLAVFALLSPTASAATPPKGSYRETCNQLRATRDVLSARCQRNNGRFVRVELKGYSDCVGDISNYDGRLVCLRRSDLPPGSWSDDCINPRIVLPGIFGADCRSLRGGRISSRIALAQCPEGVGAKAGRLVCEKRGEAEAEDDDAKIVLYERRNYVGRSFAADDDVPSIPRPLNDYASSLRIAGGSWEVCADPNYRGRCVVVRADVPNLATLGMGDRISSLRRAPGAKPPESKLPPGSWQATCRNGRIEDRILRAQCRDRGGKWHNTSLDPRDCDRDEEITNDDGDLACRSRGGRDEDESGQTPPAGSYQRSCRSIVLDGRVLTAECRNDNNAWRQTRLDLSECGEDEEIVNDDGELACRLRGGSNDNPGPFPPGTPGNGNPGPFPPSPPPGPGNGNPGPFPPGNPPPINPNADAAPPPPPSDAGTPSGGPMSGTPGNPSGAPAGAPTDAPGAGPAGGQGGGITLYEGPSFGGSKQTFRDDVADLTASGWNDHAASLKVARGRWEVCAGVNFEGPCQTFDADQGALAPELAGKISSLRRARRNE